MFNIKVFLIFSYSSVKSDAPLLPPLPPPPNLDTFVGSAGVWNHPGVCLSLAAVWGVVVWSCLIYMLGCVHKHTHTNTHTFIYVYLLNRTTVGLYVKVLFKGSSPVWRHAHACLCLAPAPQCICFNVTLDLSTWSQRALKTAGQRCQQQQTRCPAHPRSARFKVRWSLI